MASGGMTSSSIQSQQPTPEYSQEQQKQQQHQPSSGIGTTSSQQPSTGSTSGGGMTSMGETRSFEQEQQQQQLSSMTGVMQQQPSSTTTSGLGAGGMSGGGIQQQQPSTTTTGGGGMTGTGQHITESIPSQIIQTQPSTTVGKGQPTLGAGEAATAGVSRYLAEGQLPHMTTILVTGATGSTGTAVLKQLATIQKRPFNVIVGAHGAVTQDQQQFWNQFDKVCPLDANNPESLDLRGVTSLLLIPSNSENRAHQVQNYVQAAKEHGVKFILLLSVLGTDERPEVNRFTQEFKRIEDLVEDSNIPCCFLRCNFYMENLFLQTESIAKNNCLLLPFRQGRWAPISVHDVAVVICSILAHPEPHINKAYDLTGPNLVTGDHLAKCLSECVGQQINCECCSPQDYANMLVNQGVPNWLARGMADYLLMFENDRRFDTLDAQAFFRDLTGQNMTSVRQWCQENAQFFKNQISRIQQELQRQQPKAMMIVGPQVGVGAPPPTAIRAGGEESGAGGPVTLNRLKSLLHELIAERSGFTLEERQMLEKNEQKLRDLHILEKQISQMEQQPQSQLGGISGGVGIGAQQQQKPQLGGGYSAQQQQPEQQFGKLSGRAGIWEGQQQQQHQPQLGGGSGAGQQQQPEQQWGRPSGGLMGTGVREAGFAGGREGGVIQGTPGALQKMQEYGKPLQPAGVGAYQGGGQQQQQPISGGGYGSSLSGQGYPQQQKQSDFQQQQPSYGGGYGTTAGGYGKEQQYYGGQQHQQPQWQQQQPSYGGGTSMGASRAGWEPQTSTSGMGTSGSSGMGAGGHLYDVIRREHGVAH